MNLRLTITFTILLIAATISSCATSPIIPIGTDTYMISQTSAGGIFKSMSSLKAEVITRANAFAESKGKVAVAVASKESPAYPGHMPNFEYQFRLMDKDDPNASGTGLIPRADMVIENNVKPINDNPAQTTDIYNELLKLDDLQKKGIITQDEFEDLKTKLLSEN